MLVYLKEQIKILFTDYLLIIIIVTGSVMFYLCTVILFMYVFTTFIFSCAQYFFLSSN